ncbi:MAG: C40 family peptidase [Bacteroidales bacterium]
MNKTIKKLLLVFSLFPLALAAQTSKGSSIKEVTTDTFTILERMENSMKENLQLMTFPSLAESIELENKINDHYNNFIDNLISSANTFIGTPYRRGGKNPRGFDCSGFTSYIFSRYGVKLNESSRSQTSNGRKIERREDVQKGDLVFFKGSNASSKTIGHVGIVTDTDEKGTIKFIHSAISGGVRVNKVSDPYYARRYVMAVRVNPAFLKF